MEKHSGTTLKGEQVRAERSFKVERTRVEVLKSSLGWSCTVEENGDA